MAHTTEHLFIYVKGNPGNPNGVINRLKVNGGQIGEVFPTIELSNPHNIFYVDFHDDGKIKMMEDNSMLWESLKSVWTELPPLQIKETLPESWDDAVDDYYEAEAFEYGEDETTNELLVNIGKMIVLRNIWRQGWEAPEDGTPFWYIASHNGELDICKGTGWSRMMSFASKSIANNFLSFFKNQLEEIKEYI